MKYEAFYLKMIAGVIVVLFSACEVDYEYDFEPGYDMESADSSNVSIDTTGFEVDMSMYDKARAFPGLVDSSEVRLENAIISLDLGRRNLEPQDVGFSTLPLPIFSTGLYAPPGELIQIRVPSGVYGLTAQIGFHTEDLTGLNPSRREPLIYTVSELFPGVNQLRNPFGGYIWIKGKNLSGGETEIQVTGGVKAPDFVLGETSVAEWQNQVRNTSVPWFEIRSSHMAFSVPRSLVLRSINNGKLNDIDQVMEAWDEIMIEDYYRFVGMDGGDGDNIPDFPERMVLDAQLENGVYVKDGGQPIVAQQDQYWFNEWTDLEKIKNGQSWGSFRALGYNYVPSISPWWEDMREAGPNIHAFKISGIEGDLPSLGEINGVDDVFPQAIEYAMQNEEKSFENDGEVSNWIFKLTPFIQLFHNIENPDTGEDGWDFYTHLLNELDEAEFPATGDLAKKNFFFITLSEFTQRDYSSFFDAWGMQIRDYARAIAQEYTPLDKALWEYNPITKLGGDRHYIAEKIYHDRTNWIFRTNSEATNEGAANQIAAGALNDADLGTYWHSCWSGCPSNSSMPYEITVDMEETNSVSGFYLAAAHRRPETIEISVSNDNSTWESLGNFEMEDRVYKQYFELSAERTFRFFKIIIHSNHGDGSDSSLTEIGTFKNR